MITVEPTSDETFIRSVFLNPTIYGQMRDDSCPLDPSLLAQVHFMHIPGFFLKAIVDGVTAGVWMFIYKADDTVEVHTALLENCRGRKAIEAAKLAAKWVFENTKVLAVISYAWSDSPQVAWFCRMMGMVPYETKPWPATRAGKPVTITYYILNR